MILKRAMAGVLALAVGLGFAGSAFADSHHNSHGNWNNHSNWNSHSNWNNHSNWNHHSSHHGDAFISGLGGFALGTFFGNIVAGPRYYGPAYNQGYYQQGYYPAYQAPAYYQQPIYAAPVYVRPQPWTPAWFSSCSSRYRTFNPQTGYFIASIGHPKFCY